MLKAIDMALRRGVCGYPPLVQQESAPKYYLRCIAIQPSVCYTGSDKLITLSFVFTEGQAIQADRRTVHGGKEAPHGKGSRGVFEN